MLPVGSFGSVVGPRAPTKKHKQQAQKKRGPLKPEKGKWPGGKKGKAPRGKSATKASLAFVCPLGALAQKRQYGTGKGRIGKKATHSAKAKANARKVTVNMLLHI